MQGFQFKQFYVAHEKCAMKVGTDGTLLGAWCPLPPMRDDSPIRILDVGTGSGLVALMLAQRCATASVTGIDIDEAATMQAAENFAASPWANRLMAMHLSLQELLQQGGEYDLVVSNPPYFQDSLKNPDAQRTLARHTDSLPYSLLISGAAELLREGGLLALIVPAEQEGLLLRQLTSNDMAVQQVTRFYTSSKPGRPAKRVLIAAKKGGQQELPAYENLYLGSDEYKALVRAFYLYD